MAAMLPKSQTIDNADCHVNVMSGLSATFCVAVVPSTPGFRDRVETQIPPGFSRWYFQFEPKDQSAEILRYQKTTRSQLL